MTGVRRYVIAYDVGTSGVKAALVDPAGRLIDSSTHSYQLTTLPNGWVDQDLNEMLTVVADATHQLLARTGVASTEIEGIGVTAQMFNLQAVDRLGVPLLPMVSWLDLRATRIAEDLASRMTPEEQFSQFGSTVTAKDMLPKMLWLRDEHPDLWLRTAKLLDCKEAVVMYLTGAAVTDFAGASATRLADAQSGSWNQAACTALDVPVSMLPEIRPATAIAGGLLKGPAARLGLVPGTPVVVGAGDVPATQIGAGASEAGHAQLSLGTSGYWGIVIDGPLADPNRRLGLLAHVDPDKRILWLEIATAGGALSWFLRLLGQAAPDPVGLDRLVREATGDVPLFAPWLSGERAPLFDDRIRGAFVGLGLHHGLGHLLRAVMEGVAFQARYALEYGLAFGPPVLSIRCVGGGAVSDAWIQIVADVLDRTIESVKDPQDAGARGAAALALVGLGRQRDLSFVKDAAVVDRTFRPLPQLRERYERNYVLYKQLYERLNQASA